MLKTKQRSSLRKVFESSRGHFCEARKVDTLFDDIISKILNRHPELKKLNHSGDWLRIAIYRDQMGFGYKNGDDVDDAILSGEITPKDIWDGENYVVGYALARSSLQEMFNLYAPSLGEEGRDGMLDAIEDFLEFHK